MKVDADIEDMEEGNVSDSGEADSALDNRGTHHQEEDVSMELQGEGDVSLGECTD